MFHILMILGFIWWWPLGLLLLGFLIARGRLGCWRRQIYAGEGPMFDGKFGGDRWDRKLTRLQEKMGRVRDRMERAGARSDWFGANSSGNSTFDDYRAETLKRLEDEQREFKDFLERLRYAKDRAEFDQFMSGRRERPAAPDTQQPPPSA
jgi:hypothetical protein